MFNPHNALKRSASSSSLESAPSDKKLKPNENHYVGTLFSACDGTSVSITSPRQTIQVQGVEMVAEGKAEGLHLTYTKVDSSRDDRILQRRLNIYNEIKMRRAEVENLKNDYNEVMLKLDEEDNAELEQKRADIQALRRLHTRTIRGLKEAEQVIVNYELSTTRLTTILPVGKLVKFSLVPNPVVWCIGQADAQEAEAIPENKTTNVENKAEEIPLIDTCPSLSTAHGAGLQVAYRTNSSNPSFILITRDDEGKIREVGGDDVEVYIEQPQSQEETKTKLYIRSNITDYENGRYCISYELPMNLSETQTEIQLAVKVQNKHIANSPFQVKLSISPPSVPEVIYLKITKPRIPTGGEMNALAMAAEPRTKTKTFKVFRNQTAFQQMGDVVLRKSGLRNKQIQLWFHGIQLPLEKNAGDFGMEEDSEEILAKYVDIDSGSNLTLEL